MIKTYNFTEHTLWLKFSGIAENVFKSFYMEVHENFFCWILGFSSGQQKLLILQDIWLHWLHNHFHY